MVTGILFFSLFNVRRIEDVFARAMMSDGGPEA